MKDLACDLENLFIEGQILRLRLRMTGSHHGRIFPNPHYTVPLLSGAAVVGAVEQVELDLLGGVVFL